MASKLFKVNMYFVLRLKYQPWFGQDNLKIFYNLTIYDSKVVFFHKCKFLFNNFRYHG